MKVFMFNHNGSLNHGCEAIVRGTVNILKNIYPDCEFVLSSYDPESDKSIEDINLYKYKTRPLTITEKVITKVTKSERYALRKIFDVIVAQSEDCDICLSIGGDTYCYGDNLGLLVLTEELKKAGKKVVLWGASIGESDLTEDKIGNLRAFDAIFARESLTYDLLSSRNANENIFLHADPAFCMEREDMPLPNGFTKENALGINISPLIAKINPNIYEYTEKFIEYVIDNTTLNVLFVPHVLETGNNDYEYMLPLAEKFKNSGRTAILPDDLNAKQYKGCIAKLRFFIGARTHATIAAYSSGVPTYVLGYSVKSEGIAKDLFGEKKYVVDINNIDSENKLTEALNVLIEDEASIKQTLMLKIPMQMRSAMKMGEKLSEL